VEFEDVVAPASIGIEGKAATIFAELLV